MDDVDRMLGAISGVDRVSGVDVVGLDEIAYMDDAEVGRRVKRRAAAASPLAPAQEASAARTFVRSARDVARRAPGGLPVAALAAAIGAVATVTQTFSRPIDITKLVLVPSAAGAVLDSLKIGDEEQLLSPGVAVELYASGVQDPKPDNFSTLQSGIPLTMTFRNTTAGAINVTIGFKGEVNR